MREARRRKGYRRRSELEIPWGDGGNLLESVLNGKKPSRRRGSEKVVTKNWSTKGKVRESGVPYLNWDCGSRGRVEAHKGVVRRVEVAEGARLQSDRLGEIREGNLEGVNERQRVWSVAEWAIGRVGSAEAIRVIGGDKHFISIIDLDWARSFSSLATDWVPLEKGVCKVEVNILEFGGRWSFDGEVSTGLVDQLDVLAFRNTDEIDASCEWTGEGSTVRRGLLDFEWEVVVAIPLVRNREVADLLGLEKDEVGALGEVDGDGGIGVRGGELVCLGESISDIDERVAEGTVPLGVGSAIGNYWLDVWDKHLLSQVVLLLHLARSPYRTAACKSKEVASWAGKALLGRRPPTF